MTANLRAAVYLRQSQDRNGDELAISRQRTECLRLCRDRGWQPTEYTDNDKSASNGKPRPAYQRMLAAIQAGQVDAVVAYHQDRLHRDVMELLTFADIATKHDLKLVTVTGDIDLSTDDGEFMATLGAALARKEVRRKSARQKLAAEQRAEQGRAWWSARPFGFAYHPPKPILDVRGNPALDIHGEPKFEPSRPILDEDGHPTLDPVEAAEIREAYRAILAGSSCYSIAQDWNRRGVLTPRGNKWRQTHVRQLLVSPRNAGLRTFRKEVVGRGDWPAIVDESTWRGVTGKLADPARHYGPSRARRHLLSNLAQCGVEGCDGRLGSGVNSRGALIYTCKVCNKNSRNGRWLESLVIEHVVDRLSRDDAAELIVDTERPDIAELTAQRDALREQQAALGVRLANQQVSLAMAEAADRRFTEQIEALSALIVNDDEAEVYADVIGPDADVRFAALDLSRQRRIVNGLLEITVRPSGRCGRVFKREDVDVLYRKR